MDDLSRDGSPLRDRAKQTLYDQAAKLRAANARASISYFAATDAKDCDAPITIPEQGPIPDLLPEPRASVGATNLGTALHSAFEHLGNRRGRIVIISDGGQSTNCGFHVCTIAEERLPGAPNISIEPLWIDRADDASPARACLTKLLEETAQRRSGAVRSAAVDRTIEPPAPAKSASQTQPPPPSEPDVTFTNSLPWASLALMFALSFVMFGRSFAKAHRDLEVKLRTIDDDASKNSFVDFSKQKPRFIFAAIIFAAAFVASFGVLWGTGDFIESARDGAAKALNNEFGAAVFLASLMTLGVFAGSQYWRYVELRAKYALASNEADRNKKARDEAAQRRREAKEEQEKTRLEQNYDTYRTAFSDRTYPLSRFLESGEFLDSNRDLLEEVIGAIKFLAAGPRPVRDSISRADVDEVFKLATSWTTRSPHSLIDFIPAARLPEGTRALLKDFFEPVKKPLSSEQAETLKRLKKELELLVTQHRSTG